MSPRESKRRLRSELRARPSRRDGDVGPGLLDLDEWRRARVVLLFAADRHEPDVAALFDDGGKLRLAPRVDGERLDLVAVTTRPGGDGWRRGRFNLWEPVGTPADATPDLVVVPGVAFGRDGSRLGRGGGYYDKLLASLPTALRVGVCSDDRLLASVPTEPHDEGVDAVVTPSCVVRTGRGRRT